MTHQNIVDLGFDIDAITKEKEQVLQLFVDLFGKLKEYDGAKFNPLSGGGLVEFQKAVNNTNKAMGEYNELATKYNNTVIEQAKQNRQLAVSYGEVLSSIKDNGGKLSQIRLDMEKVSAGQKQLKKDYDDGKISIEAYNASVGALIERQAILKQASADVTKEITNAARAAAAPENTKSSAKAQNAILTRQSDLTDVNDAEKIEQINSLIDKNNQLIQENSDKLAKQKINIGNYAESLAPGFDGLRVELENINKQLAEIELRSKTSAKNLTGNPIGFDPNRNKGGSPGGVTNLASGAASQVSILNSDAEAYQRLTVQQKILEQGLQRQAIGFKTSNQELRNAKNTLDAMTLAGLGNTEAFEKLNVAYTKNEQRVKDLHREQAILTTDVPALTALTAVAKGIGGAYALAAGGAALFADGDEKVEKELGKLVAIMTFLQGLEEAVATLKDKNAIATALQESATKALNTVRKIEVALFGETTAAVEANTIATETNAEAQEANIGALEGAGVAAEGTTGALEGVTVAEGAAATGAITLRTALISTGIGAIVIGLIYGITKLVGAISDWISADERAEETQAALVKITQEQLETFKELQEAYSEGGKDRIEQLTKEAGLAAAAGKNQFIQLENERRINEQRKANAKKTLDDNKITEKGVDALYQTQLFALQDVYGWEQTLKEARKKAFEDNSSHNKKLVEETEKRLAQAKDEAKFQVDRYNFAKNALQESDNANHESNVIRVKTAKAAADQLEKIAADSAQRRYEIEKDASERVLNDPRSSLEQKDAAIAAGFKAEQKLAEQRIAAVRKQVADQVITQEAGANEIANIESDLAVKRNKKDEDLVKNNLERQQRYITARRAIAKNDDEGDAAIQDAITKDQQQELDNRLQALKRNLADKAKIINDDYLYQLQLATLSNKTDEEKAQFASDRDKALVALTADTQRQIYEIVVSYGERRLKAIEDLNKTGNAGNLVTGAHNDEIDALNQSFLKGEIGYRAYLRKKADADEKYRLDKDNAEIADDEAALKRIKDFEANKLDIELNAAQKALDFAKKGGNDKEIADAQAKVDALKSIRDKANADEVAATAKLNKDKAQKNDDEKEKRLKNAEVLNDRLAELEQQSFDFATQLVNDAYENEVNKIEKRIEKTDEGYDQQISAIQRSSINQRQASEEEIILNAQKHAQDTALKKEEQKAKIAEAKFDRDAALARVAWSTAAAVMKDAELGQPFSLPIIAADIALGAIQAALILSKPLPAYAEGIGIPGKGRHPGGWALVGEGGRPELVTESGKNPYLVDTPQLLNLMPDASVQPIDVNNLITRMGRQTIWTQAAMLSSPADTSDQAWEIARWTARQNAKAIARNNRKIVNIINVGPLPGISTEYYNQKILGKK